MDLSVEMDPLGEDGLSRWGRTLSVETVLLGGDGPSWRE